MKIAEDEIRAAVFIWLKEQSVKNGGIFNRNDLIYGFIYKGQVITLLGATGIWFPKGFSIPISITTISNGLYNDGFSNDGLLEYRYRGNDPNIRDNIGLKEAYIQRKPLIYFLSIKPGKYLAVWPIFIIENDPANLKIKAAIDPAYDSHGKNLFGTDFNMEAASDSIIGIRKYITAMTKQRLHQSIFREFVLDAYSRQCTMCKLQHTELLDAAHIIPDSDPDGLPIVPNGLSLCKIHHAAYDQKIIGITPDYIVKVRKDILEEIDGPMLKYGLQSMEGNKLYLPNNKSDYPDRDRLERRYHDFIAS